MPTHIELLKASAAIDARIKASAAKPPEPQKTPVMTPSTYAVYKVVDGVKGERASKAGLSKQEADKYVAQRQDNQYDIEKE